MVRVRPTRWWERTLGVVGRILIASGLLLLAFVGYQLWGTGIEQAQRQNSLKSDFEALLTATTTTVTTTTTTPTTTTSVPVGTMPPATTPPTTTTGEPDVTVPVVTPPPAVLEAPGRGEPVARLQVPSLGIDQIVVMGVGTTELKAGPGHFPGTPLPGQLGNAAIAGHRTSYGAPFGDVDRLSPGDELKFTTLAGEFRYVVTGSEIVDPSAVYVVDTVDPDVAKLTLVTCHPRYSINQRLIVYAELDESGSAPPTPPAPSTTVAPAPTTPTSPDSPSPPPSPDPEPDGLGAFDDVDPFAAGWFADDGAWWHVAGWGLLLSLLAIGTTWLGRVRRNERLGAVIGIGPFLVVLYFFFQNVNRLLPPGL